MVKLFIWLFTWIISIIRYWNFGQNLRKHCYNLKIIPTMSLNYAFQCSYFFKYYTTALNIAFFDNLFLFIPTTALNYAFNHNWNTTYPFSLAVGKHLACIAPGVHCTIRSGPGPVWPTWWTPQRKGHWSSLGSPDDPKRSFVKVISRSNLYYK